MHVMVLGCKTSVCAYLIMEEGRVLLISLTIKAVPITCHVYAIYSDFK